MSGNIWHAIRSLKDGKKVRRSHWEDLNKYIILKNGIFCVDQNEDKFQFDFNDLEQEDWVIYLTNEERINSIAELRNKIKDHYKTMGWEKQHYLKDLLDDFFGEKFKIHDED